MKEKEINSIQEISSKLTTIKDIVNFMMDENFKASIEVEDNNTTLYLKNESIFLNILSDYIDIIDKEADFLLNNDLQNKEDVIKFNLESYKKEC